MEPITEGQVWKILSGHYEGWTVVIVEAGEGRPMVRFRRKRRTWLTRDSQLMLASAFLERAERVS